MPCVWLSSRFAAAALWPDVTLAAVTLAVALFVDVDMIAPIKLFCVVLTAATGAAGDAFCVWFLLGVEHTAILFVVIALFVVALKLRSDLLARTAVGFTGCNHENIM